jgi:hypothetical protein
MEWVVVVLVVAAFAFLMFKRHQQKQNMVFMQSMFEAASFRDSLDRIIKDYSLSVPDNSGENKLEHEVIAVSKFIAKESVKRSGREISHLNDDEAYIAMLIGFVTADHVSRLAHVSFEVTSTIVCTVLMAHKPVEDIGRLTNEVINGYNRMATSPDEGKVLQAIGTQVSNFFLTSKEEFLNKLGELFELMSKHIN